MFLSLYSANSILFFLLMLMVLISIAFLTLMERKLLSYIQLRKGPNKILIKGVLQPMADGLKLFMKENYMGMNLNKFYFSFFPFLSFFFMGLFWFNYNYKTEEMILYSMMFIMLISGISVYSILGSGWASNSKYALLGSYRSIAQTISYEVSMVFIIMSIFYLNMSYSLSSWETYNMKQMSLSFGFWFLMLIWLTTILAELNRAPFDFAEGESELVSGFNVEYGSSKFALFFLAEYGNIIFMSYLTSILFLNQIFILILIFFMVWVRGAYPRYRYDNLMYLAWKTFLPIILLFLMLMNIYLNIIF